MEETLPHSLNETTANLIAKPDKDTTRKLESNTTYEYRYKKILNKTLAYKINSTFYWKFDQSN